MQAAAAGMAHEAIGLDPGRTLANSREAPYERSLARNLDAALGGGSSAATGGTPRIPGFPGVGYYDVSARNDRGELVLAGEFKWWGRPRTTSGLPDKRDETLWDLVKIACARAVSSVEAGYLVTLAPTSAWHIPHLFSELFDGGVWTIDELVGADESALRFFDEDQRESLRVPSSIRTESLADEAIHEPETGESWALRCCRVEPAGSDVPMP